MIKKIFFSLFFLVFFLHLFVSYSFAQGNIPQEERMEGKVTRIIDERMVEYVGSPKKQLYQKIEIEITTGNRKGQKVIIENGNVPSANVISYKTGDSVIVSATKDPQGKDVFYISDYVRKTPLALLFIIFVALVVLIGRKRGIASLFGMVISFIVIFSFILPMISRGNDPIIITVIASFVIIPTTFYLSHGLNKKTTFAVIGTITSLVLTGMLANAFMDFAHLTGFTSDEATFLENLRQGDINMKGLLLAGIIIGALGILDDVTISQAAIIVQLKKASPKLSFQELFKRGMDVGRDHIASVVNTLILVYTGAALPLLLLFINNPHPFGEVINYEIIAEEIVRTLVASIGLIAAVPITTLLAAFFVYTQEE